MLSFRVLYYLLFPFVLTYHKNKLLFYLMIVLLVILNSSNNEQNNYYFILFNTYFTSVVPTALLLQCIWPIRHVTSNGAGGLLLMSRQLPGATRLNNGYWG